MKLSLPVLLSLASLGASAVAQTPSSTTIVTGTAVSARTGQDVASVGDLDGDDIDDIVVGIEEDSTNGFQFSGRAVVYSGASIVPGQTPVVIHDWTGGFIGDRLGCAVDGAGDVDGDGVPDVVVGARGVDKLTGPPYYGDAGSVSVFSGATGGLLFQVDCWQLTSPSFAVDDARFGYSVAGAGDVNADGYADIIVGSYVGTRQQSLGGEGAAVVISGRTSTVTNGGPPIVLHSFHGNAPQMFLGFAVDGAGDVNGDFYDDLIVGAVDAGDNNGNGAFAGEVRIFDGQTGALIDSITGSSTGEFLGGSVAGVGDVDRDGFDDVALGVVFGSGTGEARVHSGAQLGVMPRPANAVLHQLNGGNVNDLFGFDVNGGGDMDGDGHPDIIVGAILASGVNPVSGIVRVYSGVPPATLPGTSTLLQQFDGPQSGGGYGFSVALGGDHDGDGYAEALVGTPFHDVGGVTDAGLAEMLDYGTAGTPPRSRQLGPGCPATRMPAGMPPQTVLPTLQLRGRPGLGETFEMRLRGCPLSQPWILNIGAPVNINLTPFGMPGCWLYATGTGFVYMPVPPTTHAVHGTGRFVLPVPIPVNTALIGQPIAFQANILAPNGPPPAGVVVSNGLELTFGN